MHKKVHSNEISASAHELTKERLRKVKMSIWKVIILMWYF